MNRVRATFLVGAAIVAFAATACGDGPTASGGTPAAAPIGAVANGPADKSVNQVAGQKFDPAAVTVKVGQTVQWKNTDSVAHNVTFADHDDISIGSMSQNATFEVKFTVPGSYDYVCTFHAGMNGTVTVTP